MSWGSSTTPLGRAQPPSHFLVRASSLAAIVVLSLALSSYSNSCYYAIVRGVGMRRREERIVSVVKGESIVSIATNESKWKEGSRTQHNGEGNFALYSTTSSKEE